MALIIPKAGEALFLQYLVGKVEAGSPVLRLYSNDWTPDASTVASHLTESTADGYAPITLRSEAWALDTSSGVAAIVYPEQPFAFKAATKNYGYYLTDALGEVLCVERFPGAPYESPDGGGKVYVMVGLTLSNVD